MTPPRPAVRISVVVVAYNSAASLGPCLASLDGAAEIIVVDNASQDHSIEAIRHACPRAQLIRNTTNRGFAAAANQGVRESSCPLILLLNPDAALQTPLSDSHPMALAALRPQIGVVGGRLVDAAGDGSEPRVQKGFAVRGFPTAWTLAAEALLLNRAWPLNPLNKAYRLIDFDWSKPQPCDQPAGAFLMFRREVFEALGGFDESFYPLWFEDVDFCLRAQRSGLTNWYEPRASALHQGAHSIESLTLHDRNKSWYGSLLRFSEKHYSTFAATCLRLAVIVGLALRGILAALGIGRRGEQRAYYDAMKAILARRTQSVKGRKDENVRRSFVI